MKRFFFLEIDDRSIVPLSGKRSFRMQLLQLHSHFYLVLFTPYSVYFEQNWFLSISIMFIQKIFEFFHQCECEPIMTYSNCIKHFIAFFILSIKLSLIFMHPLLMSLKLYAECWHTLHPQWILNSINTSCFLESNEAIDWKTPQNHFDDFRIFYASDL